MTGVDPGWTRDAKMRTTLTYSRPIPKAQIWHSCIPNRIRDMIFYGHGDTHLKVTQVSTGWLLSGHADTLEDLETLATVVTTELWPLVFAYS